MFVFVCVCHASEKDKRTCAPLQVGVGLASQLKNLQNQTALHVAIESGAFRVQMKLLEHVNIDEEDKVRNSTSVSIKCIVPSVGHKET